MHALDLVLELGLKIWTDHYLLLFESGTYLSCLWLLGLLSETDEMNEYPGDFEENTILPKAHP